MIKPYNVNPTEYLTFYGSNSGTINSTQMATFDFYPVGSGWIGSQINYVVLKGNNVQFNNSTPMAVFTSPLNSYNSHVLFGAYANGANYNPIYQQYFTGTVVGRTISSVSAYSPLIQALYTPTKRWA